MTIRGMLPCVLLGVGMLAILGCGQSGNPSSGVAQPEASTPAVSDVAVTPEMADLLAKADALDGQTDKIVSRCASCALGMDGSEEHSLRVGEYTMYFCKEDCQQAFDQDVAESVLAMKVPAAGGSDSP